LNAMYGLRRIAMTGSFAETTCQILLAP